MFERILRYFEKPKEKEEVFVRKYSFPYSISKDRKRYICDPFNRSTKKNDFALISFVMWNY